MALHEDAASVLEQFVQDVANLPAEIAHLLEEIEAKDKVAQECRTAISSRDSSIQRHLKQNGCSTANPKEDGYCKVIASSFDKVQLLQNEKVALSEKAASLLDRQLKRLDIHIKSLENAGILTIDGSLPSILTPGGGGGASTTSTTGVSTPLHPISGNNATSFTATAMTNAAVARLIGTSQSTPNRRDSIGGGGGSSAATPTASTPISALAARNAREGSIDTTNNKKRRLANQPQQSSGLRQSSLGPSSAPKLSTPTTTQGRAGSAGPRSSASTSKAHKTIAGQPKRAGSSLNPATATKKAGAARRKGGVGGGRKGVHGLKVSPSDGDESALSEVGDSETERATQVRSLSAADGAVDAEMGGMEEEDEEEADGDNRKYCTCRSVSYGNMIACDNDECEYEWFHWGCVGMTKEPAGKWYCDACKGKMVVK